MGTTFGSTTKEELPDEGMVIASAVANKTATMSGVSAELQIQKQQIKELHEKLAHMNAYCQSLQLQFDDFKKQRVIELQAQVGHGPTST